MVVKDKKTVRFDALVKQFGNPEQVTLWTKPEEDREFMAAVKARRVVTVLQTNVGTKKDFGQVGFFPEKKAAFLIFPKAISEADETKVVGIKYERLASSLPKGGIHKPTTKRPPGISMQKQPAAPLKKNRKQERVPARLFRFRATIQLHAHQEEIVEVEACNSAEAAKLLKDRSAEVRFDPEKAKITTNVTKQIRRK